MITLEGNFIVIEIIEPNSTIGEVIDLENKVIFQGRIVEATCESYKLLNNPQSRYSKVTLTDYTAKPLPKGYHEKKAIKKVLKEMDGKSLWLDDDGKQLDKVVNRIYDELKREC